MAPIPTAERPRDNILSPAHKRLVGRRPSSSLVGSKDYTRTRTNVHRVHFWSREEKIESTARPGELTAVHVACFGTVQTAPCRSIAGNLIAKPISRIALAE